MSKRHYLLILLALGLLTRFLFFGHPNETVFDEVHFGKFISAYYTHQFYFDIHPALGKLMIAGFAKLADFKPEFAFAEIGEKFPDKQYEILRFLPSLAGALLPIVIYLILLEFGVGLFGAFTGGLFIVFENALLTQSHYILLDSFLLLFGFPSLLFYIKYAKHTPHKAKYLILSGVFSGLALSVKWLALSFIGLPLLFEGLMILYRAKKEGFKNIQTSKIILTATSLIVIPMIIYFSVFMIDFSVLTKSGTGDAFMSPGFQKTLQGSRYESDPTVVPANVFQKFVQLNVEMYNANQRLTATHPYSSPWYTWPLMTRPIYYWVDGASRIYLMGNPIIWWLSTAAILYVLMSLIFNIRLISKNKVMIFLITGYVANMLPFIGVHRVMFLYHYFLAYIFAIMILIYILDASYNDTHDQQKSSVIFSWLTTKKIYGAIIIASIVSFIFFAPLSYGLNLSPQAYQMRVWISSWR